MKRLSVVLAVAALAFSAVAQPVLTPYGLGMYRFRYEILSLMPDQGDALSAGNYSNRLAFRLGTKVAVNDQVSGQFEIGNDWFATEDVSMLPGNYMIRRDANNSAWFSLAFMQWDPKVVHLQAGIIPVKGSAMMDLIGASLYFDRIYANAAQLPWGVLTNFSIPGTRFGVPFAAGDLKFAVDVATSIYEPRLYTFKDIPQEFRANSPAVPIFVDVPMSFRNLTLLPQAAMILNRNYDTDDHGVDHEISFGIDGGLNIMGTEKQPIATLRAGFAMAMLSNKNTWDPADRIINGKDTIVVTRRDQVGMNITTGISIPFKQDKLGTTSKLDIDFNYSTDENTFVENSAVAYPFVDVKYGWAVNKNFIVMPRTRLFLYLHETKTEMKVWPELMLFGSF